MHINKNFIDDNLKDLIRFLVVVSLASVMVFPLTGFMAYSSGMNVETSILLSLIIPGLLIPLLSMAAIIPEIVEYYEPVFIKKILSEDEKVHTIESVEFHEKIIASAPSLSLTNKLNNILSDSNVKVKFTGIKKEYEMPYSEYLGLDGKAIIKTQTILNLWDKEKVITLSSPEKVS